VLIPATATPLKAEDRLEPLMATQVIEVGSPDDL
jgi:hypothetical protein